MEQVRILNPFKGARKVWRCLEEEGLRCRLFGIINKEPAGANNRTAVMEH